jgi:hypothetical protein
MVLGDDVRDSVDPWFFRRATLVCPLPIATACGRVYRARTPQEKVDACLKAGEVLARYLAAIALSSFAARDADDELQVDRLDGNLAFGQFLNLAQQITKLKVNHPAASYLDGGFRQKKKGKGRVPGPTDSALVALLELRNDLGHQLANLTQARAEAIVSKRKPERFLADGLRGVEALLSLPLFVVEEQRMVKRIVRARRLLLMGESADPPPDEVELNEPLEDDRVPYLAVGTDVLRLPPCLIWDLVEERANYRLLFLDRVKAGKVRYRTLEANEKEVGGGVMDTLSALSSGKRRSCECVTLRDGRHLAEEWGERRDLIEEAGRRGEGHIPWDQMDEGTLSWYGHKLGADAGELPKNIVAERLLDGRTSVSVEERRQLLLLFGKPGAVRRELGRDLTDLRAVTKPGARWDERKTIDDGNLIRALQAAVEFFSRHISAEGVTLDGLVSTTGSADYVAIREALVNQFIHQDYADQSAPAQVEIQPDTTVFFNVGFSLVGEDKLVEGGKSQSRNPLIARALRLIGFAELAGSGIRALQYEWRQARRRPPRFESDRKANTFTLTLDWRSIPNAYDEYWKERIGAQLTPNQATVLNLARDPDGITREQAASATGLRLDEAEVILDYLVRQVLVEEHAGRFRIQQHLRELV